MVGGWQQAGAQLLLMVAPIRNTEDLYARVGELRGDLRCVTRELLLEQYANPRLTYARAFSTTRIAGLQPH